MAAKTAKMLYGRWGPLQADQFGLLNFWRAYSHEARSTSRTMNGNQFHQHMAGWYVALMTDNRQQSEYSAATTMMDDEMCWTYTWALRLEPLISHRFYFPANLYMRLEKP